MTNQGASATTVDQPTFIIDDVGVPLQIGPQLGRRLTRLMKEKDLNDRVLGERALISRTTVYNLRHGFGGQVGLNTIVNLAKALGVRAAWLAFGEGPQLEPKDPISMAELVINKLPKSARIALIRKLYEKIEDSDLE